jgi:hypothetical protein
MQIDQLTHSKKKEKLKELIGFKAINLFTFIKKLEKKTAKTKK